MLCAHVWTIPVSTIAYITHVGLLHSTVCRIETVQYTKQCLHRKGSNTSCPWRNITAIIYKYMFSGSSQSKSIYHDLHNIVISLKYTLQLYALVVGFKDKLSVCTLCLWWREQVSRSICHAHIIDIDKICHCRLFKWVIIGVTGHLHTCCDLIMTF